MGLVVWKKGALKPLIIILTAIGLGLTVLGLTLTILGTRPGYASYGGNPLKIIGPIMLVLGVLTLMGVIVEWCVRSNRDKKEPEKAVNLSSPRETFKSQPSQKIRPRTKDPPLMTSTGNPPTPVFRPEDALPQAQEKLASVDYKNEVPRSNNPLNKAYSNGNHHSGVNFDPSTNYNRQGPKTAHFQPIHQAPPHPSAQYAQIQHSSPQHQGAALKNQPPLQRTEYTELQQPKPQRPTERQVSASSGNYFFPSQGGQSVGYHPPQENSRYDQGGQSVGYHPPQENLKYDPKNIDGQNEGAKLRWGTSKESLDKSVDMKELPVLDITRAGKDVNNKQKSGHGDKTHRTGSYREANKDKLLKGESQKAQRRPQKPYDSDHTDVKKKYAAENHAYVHEMPVDVQTESTPRDRSYGSHNDSKDYRHSPKGDREGNNFQRRNSSRTRRGSKRRHHSRGRNDSERTRDRERSRSRERPRERSSSRGRLGLDDSTTLDYVRGVPLDKESRRKAPRSLAGDTDDERHHKKHHYREGDARRNYESDDSRVPHHRKNETFDSESPSDLTRSDNGRRRHKNGSKNDGYSPEYERALSPMTRAGDLLNTREAKEAKHFTININAQPGSAVQIALGNQGLPTPKPMITATPLKTEVSTRLEES